MPRNELHIVVDRREQRPYSFTGASIYEGTTVEAGTLNVGDYSLRDMGDLVACERKSLDDLAGCLAADRERFERELLRSRALEAFAVVIEAPWEALAKGQYRSRLNPLAATQSVAAFMSRLRVPFWFCGSRAAAEFCCWSFLKQYVEGQRQRFKAVERALGMRPPKTCRHGIGTAGEGASSSPAQEA